MPLVAPGPNSTAEWYHMVRPHTHPSSWHPQEAKVQRLLEFLMEPQQLTDKDVAAAVRGAFISIGPVPAIDNDVVMVFVSVPRYP